MSDRNELASSRARSSSTSERIQPRFLHGRAASPSLALIAVTAILALGGPGSISVAASSSSPALGSGRSGSLAGVSADSATDVWAVGYSFTPTQATKTLALHWNGTSWSKVASPNPAGATGGFGNDNILSGVSARSATDAWAVGVYTRSSPAAKTLVLHWNGTSWSKVASPNPGGSGGTSDLTGVSADSATDAWAVGFYVNPTTHAQETLALHWNGTSWSKVASPNPGGSGGTSYLVGVSAHSATDAWAVGVYTNPTTQALETLALHWNGTSWHTAASPNPGGTGSGDTSTLSGVSANSTTDAWAVGVYTDPTTSAQETLTLHWNGTGWSTVASPNPGGTGSGDTNTLSGVSADSTTDAWAVGVYTDPTTSALETLVLHWNGISWSIAASPNPGGTVSGDFNALAGVSADSTSDAWAGGYYNGGTLVVHWNGTSWSEA